MGLDRDTNVKVKPSRCSRS